MNRKACRILHSGETREIAAHTTVSHPLCGGDLSIAYIAIEATKWVWNESSSTGHTRLVLLAIAAHCNADGWAWPRLETLEEASNSSRPTVIQAIDKLEELGEIEVERGGKGPGSVHRYYLKGFVERVKKGKKEVVKGKIEPELRVNPADELEHEQTESLQSVIREKTEEFFSQNKNLEKERLEEPPSSSVRKFEEELERKRQHKEQKEARKRGERVFKNTPRVASSNSRPVTSKQPESWIWFSRIFKQHSDVNAVTMPELWPMVDEMLSEISQEEAEERLSIYIDGAPKVSGYLAKDFLAGGWKTIDPEEEHLPKIVNEG